MIYNKSNKEILAELNNYVYGHDEAKKTLITLINRSKIRRFQKACEYREEDGLISPGRCLLLGESGTGKTFLIQSLAKIVEFPLLIVDATTFNPTGASGGVKADTLKKMIDARAREYRDMAQKLNLVLTIPEIVDQMVIFVDEFDKLASHYEGSTGNWNKHIQTNFLTLIENYEEFSGITWIFAGAFSGMDSKTKFKKTNIGFNATHGNEEVVPEITDEDVIKYGLLPELVGRLTAICSLNKLTEDDYYNILNNIVVPKKLSELIYFGILDSNLEEEFLRKIAVDACKSSQGVRYLNRAIDKFFLEAEFRYEEFKYDL